MADLRTPRLLLRSWRPDDIPAFAAMNADPEVRRWFPGTMTREASDASAARLQAHIDRHGFGFWAVEAPGVSPFIGFVGLMHVPFEAPFTPAVEAGWRLARAFWRQGYATEAAHAALDHGFGALGLAEVVAYTAPGNVASRRTMERLGMTHDEADDFDVPSIPSGDPMRRHVLYRVRRQMRQREQTSSPDGSQVERGRRRAAAVLPATGRQPAARLHAQFFPTKLDRFRLRQLASPQRG